MKYQENNEGLFKKKKRKAFYRLKQKCNTEKNWWRKQASIFLESFFSSYLKNKRWILFLAPSSSLDTRCRQLYLRNTYPICCCFPFPGLYKPASQSCAIVLELLLPNLTFPSPFESLSHRAAKVIFCKSDYDTLLFKILQWFMITPEFLNLHQAKDRTCSGLRSPLQFYPRLGSPSGTVLLPHGLVSVPWTYENRTCFKT